MADMQASSLERASDIGTSPEAVARRWKLELKLADKREASWRKKVTEIYKLYTPESPAVNSFNILWPNTETLRQAVYNSLPQPDARRRYQDDDPLGKEVGNVLTRSLEFCQDTYDFDAVLKGDVLSMLLAGRAVSRVRYVPDIRSESAEGGAQGDEAQEPDAYEEIAWEQVICERVQWDSFRILGAAKTWDEVQAIAFMHRFTRDDCVEKFGADIGKKIPLDSVDDEDVKKSKDTSDLFKTAQVWEIWDKDEKEVIFICPTFPVPCKTQPDPLQMQGFFPVPRPLYAIENDQTLVPASLYTQYEQQAKELNKISARINKLIEALKVRGVYDSTLTELSELMKGQDNDLIPAANVTALLERGGLDAAIWMMPIDTAASVLKELYVQRDATKQVIYEITGISDIMRSASDPNETFGAQRIKTQWGTQRLQRMQQEVQRYIRDLIRLKAEVISEKFQMETLEAMTLVKLPHQAEVDAAKQQAIAQYQQQAQAAQQQGQQPPPPPPAPPDQITWEAVVQAMRSDATRTYRVDIETDSTLSATQDSDMGSLKELLTGLNQIMTGFAPAVQQGAMSVDVVKEMMLVVCRRAKMGTAVEDAISKIQQPPPVQPPDPNEGKMQIEQLKQQGAAQAKAQDLQLEQQRMAMEQRFNDQQAANDMRLAQAQQAYQAQQDAQTQQMEHQREMQRQEGEQRMAQMQAMIDERLAALTHQTTMEKAQIDSATKIEVAEIAAGATLDAAQYSAAQQATEGGE